SALVETPAAIATRPVSVGVVSFLNTLPLIDGLERLTDIRLQHSVPSQLVDQLVSGNVQLALCSSIDYQRAAAPVAVAPVWLLGGDGQMLTVRIYSVRPIREIAEVACDTDSHTSIALLRILLREMHGIDPVLSDYDSHVQSGGRPPTGWPNSVLLI